MVAGRNPDDRADEPIRSAPESTDLENAKSGPLPIDTSDWDAPWGGTPDHRIVYFGFCQPRFRKILLLDGEFDVDVIDTWNRAVTAVPGIQTGTVPLPLPGRQYMAICVRRRS